MNENSAVCCCRYGAAVSGEFPEMPCHKCPKPEHGGELAEPGELCKRHKGEAAGFTIPEPLPNPTTEVDADGRMYIDWHETPRRTTFLSKSYISMPRVPEGMQLLACSICGVVVTEMSVGIHSDFHQDLGF